MFTRLSLTAALLVSVIPSFGMAGVITCAWESVPSNGQSISASLADDATPEPDYPERLKEHREMAGLSSVSVNTISNPSTAIHGSTVLFLKPVPPLESSYGFDEWQFVPNSPVFRIPRVPID
jgi:hypothetical protein